MADQSFQLLFEIITKGGPQAQEALKQVTQAAKEGSADAIKLLDQLARQEEKTATSVKQVTAAQNELADSIAHVREEIEKRDAAAAKQFRPNEAHVQDFKANQKAEAERLRGLSDNDAHLQDFKAHQKSEAEHLRQVTQAKKEAAKEKRAAEKKQQEEEGGGHSNTSLIRHFGAVAGNAVGFPGLGMLSAAGGGVAAAGIGISLAVDAMRDLTAQLNGMVQASHSLDEVKLKFDSLASSTRALAQEHRLFLREYKDIERQVKSTAAAIEHLTSMNQDAANWENKLADAVKEHVKARLALQTLFNPVGRIRGEAEVDKQANKDQIERDRKAERDALAAQEEKKRLATAREAKFKEVAKDAESKIPKEQSEANTAAGEATEIATADEKKRAAAREEMILLDEMALGKAGLWDITKYNWQRATTLEALNPSSKASDRVVELGSIIASGGEIFNSELNQALADAADIRRKELKNRLKSLHRTDADATDVANKEATDVKLLGGARGDALGEIKKAETDRQEADKTIKQLQEQIRQNEQYRQRILELQNESIDDRSKQRILESTPPVELPPTGGGASIDNRELLEKLDQLASQDRAPLDLLQRLDQLISQNAEMLTYYRG